MRLGNPAVDLPASSPVLQTSNEIRRAFPQAPSPAQVVVTGQDLAGPAVRHAIIALQARAAAGGRAARSGSRSPPARWRAAAA